MSDDAATPLMIPALRPLYAPLVDLADLVLRVLVGLLFVPHGYAKIFTNTPFFLKFFAGLGLNPPIFFTYFIGGLLTRPLAFMLFIDMAVASIMVHLPRGWSGPGGAEYVVTLTIISLVVAMRGSGRYSVDRLIIGREF